MTTKSAIIASIAVFVAGIVLSIVLIVLFINPNTRTGAARASQLGEGVAMLCIIPLGAIWIMWAARVRRERDRK